MSNPASTLLARFFAFVVAKRRLVIAFYALLLPPAAWYAVQVRQDNAIDRLIVPGDPDYVRNTEFRKVFGSGEYAVLVAEANDPFSVPVLERLDRIETALGAIPGVEVSSALSVFRRAKAGFEATPEQAEAFRKFATGTELLRRQGMVGDGFLAIALVLDVAGSDARREKIAAIDRALEATGAASPPLSALRKVGQPYVAVALDDDTQRSNPRYFPLFGALIVALNLALYRSARTLAAFLITLGVCMAVSVGFIGVTGGTFSIVSPMVPMTILVTVTATLVYVHSRFVDCPPGADVERHRIFALENKFLACTASIAATAVGFAALAVSDIRPIREMGIWVAVGLALSWVVVFTLFPALQKVLRTPTRGEAQAQGPWFLRLADRLPGWSYTWRWPLVLGSIVASALGAVALFGAPGVAQPMPLLTNPLEYMSRSSPVYHDTRRLEPVLPGLSITEVWLKGTVGTFSEPDVLTGLHGFQQALEKDPDVGAAISATTILRMMRYIAGEGDGWPADAEARDALAADLEGLLPTEPMLQRFVQKHSIAQTHVSVVTRVVEHEGFQALEKRIRERWAEAVKASPALAPVSVEIVGLTPLQAKMSQNLVPTLVESFVLTVVIIFGTFLLIFRSGPARIMAMIPSIFSILVMFGVMRATGMLLNVATILIASTVLGTSENDQIHFFYHFLEKRKEAGVEEALRHTLVVSGRAILFATLINAGGFLAFALADLPPMRQFGILSALAFVLSMVADFTALPAALWILFRQKPASARVATEDAPAPG